MELFASNYLNHSYKTVRSIPELDKLIGYCKDTGTVSFDFETNGHEVHDKRFAITIMGVSFQPGSSYIVPLAHEDSPFDNWQSIFNRFMRSIIGDPDIDLYVFNALFEMRILLKYGYVPRGRFFDVMLMKYMLNEDRPNDLKSLVEYMLPDWGGYDLPGQPGKNASRENIVGFWSNVPLTLLAPYCAKDTDATLRLGIHFHDKLITHDLYHFIRNFYNPLILILSRTILEGLMVDREYLLYAEEMFKDKLEGVRKSIMNIPEISDFCDDYIAHRVRVYVQELQYELDNEHLTDRQVENRENKIRLLKKGIPSTRKEESLFEPVNFNSVNQLKDLLFSSELGLGLPIMDRTESGAPSTSEDTLIKLAPLDDSGFVRGLLDLRADSTIYTTFLKGIKEERITPNDTIHPSYLLHGTITGRLSSRGPNIQNIPRVTTNNFVKPMFIAPPDYFFAEFDLSQAELRVAAEMSQDPVMIGIFKEGKNIHVATAAEMFNIPYGEVNAARKDENHPDHEDMVKKHKAAKVLNFTIFYGAGPETVGEFISKSTGDRITKAGAIDFIDQWFDVFPVTAQWIKKEQRKAIRDGYVTNLFGRKRRLHILKDKANKDRNRGAWHGALRNAINAPIQSGASDVTQWINIQIFKAMLDGKIPPYVWTKSTVHDSLEFYIHKSDIHRVSQVILEIGRTLPDLGKYMGYEFSHVDMKISGEMGINWGRMHEYDPKEDYEALYAKEWEAYNLDPFPHTRYY